MPLGDDFVQGGAIVQSDATEGPRAPIAVGDTDDRRLKDTWQFAEGILYIPGEPSHP